MLDEFKTILNEGVGEIIEKKSRFIATARPVKTEEEAKLFIEEMKKKYWNATHNVFAYQIGEGNELQRFSDDGEPQGTAGMPVLNVLKGEAVKDTAVVVTRYFGGTLLGTGGLVRAYTKAAKEGLLAAGIATLVLYIRYDITTEYTDAGKLQYYVLQEGHVLFDTQYADKVTFTVLVKAAQTPGFEKKLLEIFRGETPYQKGSEIYGVMGEDGLRIIEQDCV